MWWHCSHCAESREKKTQKEKKKANTHKQKDMKLTDGFDKCCTYEYLYVIVMHATVQFYLVANAIHTSRRFSMRW